MIFCPGCGWFEFQKTKKISGPCVDLNPATGHGGQDEAWGRLRRRMVGHPEKELRDRRKRGELQARGLFFKSAGFLYSPYILSARK